MKTSNRSRASLVRRIGGGRRGEHLHALPQIGVGRLWSEESVERLVNVSWDLADLWGEERKGRRGEHLHAERLVNVGWDVADHRLDDSTRVEAPCETAANVEERKVEAAGGAHVEGLACAPVGEERASW